MSRWKVVDRAAGPDGASSAPPGMTWIPGGTFVMGSDEFYPEERPAHPVSVDGFWMDATPVTVEFRSDVNPFVGDKPKEKRGLKTVQKERRERRLKKDRAKRAPKKKGRQ